MVWTGLDESATLKVRLEVPLAVGVPEMTPVAGARLSPAGRLPDVMDQVYGVVPPVALSVAEKSLFGIPPGKLVEVMASGLPCPTIVRFTG